MMLKDSAVEWAYVLLFCIFLAYAGMAAAMNYQLKHAFPYGFSASDAFGEIAYTEGIKDSGNYRHLPYYVRAGFGDTLGFHMPISNHIFAIFSFASGLPVWDSLMVMGFFYSILGVLVMYLIIRNFNRNVALLSLPLSVFLYIRNFSIVYTWGIWDLVMATSLLLSAVWLLSNTQIKFWHLLFAVLASGTALTHITEAFFLFVFTLLFFIIRLIRKKSSLAEIKQLITGSILALILSFYYLVIFKVGYAAGGIGNSIKYQAPEWYDVVFSQFGWFQIIILIGLIVSLYLLFAKKENNALLIGIFMLFVGFSNFISSTAPRAFQTRYLWPIYLSVFLGLAIYFLLKILIKEWKIFYSIAISIILTVSISYGYYTKSANSGIVSEYHWNHIQWVRDNTAKDAKLLYFYGDPYSQEAVLWNLKRVSFRVSMNDFVSAINERKIKREYIADVAAADDAELLYRKSAFSFGYHAKETDMSQFSGKKDVCSFDYLVFDKAGRQQALANYNLLIASELVKNGLQPVFDNGVVLILKNNNPGGKCIEERNI